MPPRIRVTQILMLLGILVDLVWRVATRNFAHPSFVDIPATRLVGFYFGKRPKKAKADEGKKSKWIRIS